MLQFIFCYFAISQTTIKQLKTRNVYNILISSELYFASNIIYVCDKKKSKQKQTQQQKQQQQQKRQKKQIYAHTFILELLRQLFCRVYPSIAACPK